MSKRFLVAVLVAGALVAAGCTSPVAGSPSGVAPPPPRFGPTVPQPKDARGIPACDLLTPDQLLDLGLLPDTAEPGGDASVPTCGWRSTDPGGAGGVQLNTALAIPVLDGLYLVRDKFAVYEPLEVAGHPAVHADGNAGPVCTIYVAISDYQGVSADGNLGGRPLPDPCAPSRRMAEFILSNLPPLR